MTRTYGWAANPQKLARAIGLAKGADESVVKTEYIKIGGLLINEETNMDPIQESEEVVVEQTPEEVQVEETVETKNEEAPVEETGTTE